MLLSKEKIAIRNPTPIIKAKLLTPPANKHSTLNPLTVLKLNTFSKSSINNLNEKKMIAIKMELSINFVSRLFVRKKPNTKAAAN